jgi:hypothetical protein
MYADFDELIAILQDCNPQLPVRKAVTGIDNLQLAKSLRPTIDTIHSDNSFNRLLGRVLDCMYDIHAKSTHHYDAKYDNLKGIDTVILNYRRQQPPPQRSLGVYLRGNPLCINGEYFLGGTYHIIKFNDTGINDTFNLYYSKIIAFNDIPYKKYIQETLEKYPNAGVRWNNQKKEYYHTCPLIYYPGILTIEDRGKIINLDFYHKEYGTNIIQSDTVEKPNIPSNDKSNNGTILYLEKDKILFIGLNRMYDPEENMVRQIREIAKDKPVDHIIIDVRDNRGGSDLVWHGILKAIVADSLVYNPVMAFKNTKRIKKLYDYPNAFTDFKKLTVKQFDWLPEETFIVTNFEPDYIVPDTNSLNYKGKIYILQNEEVYSSGHALASYASHVEQLVSVGEPSGLLAGFGLNPALFQLKHSKFTFRLETAIDVSLATKPIDVYQNIPEIIIEIPSEKKLEYEQDWHYNRHCENYLYGYDYLFKKVLELIKQEQK